MSELKKKKKKKKLVFFFYNYESVTGEREKEELIK